MCGQRHDPAALTPGIARYSHTGGWIGLMAGLYGYGEQGNSRPLTGGGVRNTDLQILLSRYHGRLHVLS